MNKLFLSLINFYQKYLSVLSHGSCRYYPTCSEYSKIQFSYNNFFIAFYFSIIRILSCNKLSQGGFDYPKVRHNLNNVIFKKIKIKFWLIPTEDGRFYIIKNWDRNRK
ncbi:MAG: membrane protein insertion efficiency factor YidD [Epsilonproteobacteria bacterium]|nr:membrane protein insertion efficiency factor YidD [Campylobacterota bacterium]